MFNCVDLYVNKFFVFQLNAGFLLDSACDEVDEGEIAMVVEVVREEETAKLDIRRDQLMLLLVYDA